MGGTKTSESDVSKVENWRQLRLSLPERFQSKLQQVDARKSAKVFQLPLPFEEKQRQLSAIAVDWPAGRVESHPESAKPNRQDFPSLGETEEFNQWFTLAIQLQLVSDSNWQDGEYWVESLQGICPYAELAATFTLKAMKRMLGLERGD